MTITIDDACHVKSLKAQATAIVMAAGPSSSSSTAGSATSSEVVRAPAPMALDICRVTVVSATCKQERNCSECMDAAVTERPDGCYLDATSGICQSFTQLNTTISSQQWQALESANVFWSAHRQYCKPPDSACVLCARVAANAQFVPSIDELKRMSPDRRVCYGDGGCICVAACQTPERVSFTSTRCPVPTMPAPATTQSIMASPSIQVTIVCVLGCFLLLRCIGEYLRIRWARQRAAVCSGGGGSRRSSRLAGANSLRLSGWYAWQHEMRELEKSGELNYVDLQTPMPRTLGSSHVEAHDDDVVMPEPRASI